MLRQFQEQLVVIFGSVVAGQCGQKSSCCRGDAWGEVNQGDLQGSGTWLKLKYVDVQETTVESLQKIRGYPFLEV